MVEKKELAEKLTFARVYLNVIIDELSNLKKHLETVRDLIHKLEKESE